MRRLSMLRRLLAAGGLVTTFPGLAFSLNATPASNCAIGWFPASPDLGLDDYPLVVGTYEAQGYDWEAWFEQTWYAVDPACSVVDLPVWLRNDGNGRGAVYTRTFGFALEDGRTGVALSFYEVSALGYESMRADYSALLDDYNFVDGEEIAMLQFSEPSGYAIGFFSSGIARLSSHNGKRATSFVYTAVCGGARFAASWDAHVVLSYGDDCPAQVSGMTGDSDLVFSRMNGEEGVSKRAVLGASAGTALVLAGDGAWVLAPTVVAFSPPANFQFHNKGPFELICEFDTRMEEVADPFYVHDGWMLADTEVPGYEGPSWLDDHTVRGWCVVLTCPGPVGARVNASAARSLVGKHRIDGGTAGQRIGVGPSGDDFHYEFSTSATHSNCMSWAVDYCKLGAFRDRDACVVFWAVDYERGTVAYDVYALAGGARSLLATVPAGPGSGSYAPARYAVSVRSEARRFQIIERDAWGEATASRPFPLGQRPPDFVAIADGAQRRPARLEPTLFPADDLSREGTGGGPPTAAIATDYVFVVSTATPAWESALTPVTSRLSTQGRSWQIVRTSQSPVAIRSALLPIYQAWLAQPGESFRPRVILVGAAYEDAADPRNILGTFYREDPTGACTFTPTCSCDQLLVDFGADLMPDLPLTRVPARTLEQLQHAVTTFQDVLDRATGTDSHVVFMNGDMRADCVPLEEPTRTLLDVRDSYLQAGYSTTWLADSGFDCDDYAGRRGAAIQAIDQGRPCDLTGTGVTTQRFVGPGLFMQSMIWPYWDQSLVNQRLRLVGLFPGCDLADTDRVNDWGWTIGETWTLADPAGASASFWISHGRGHWGTGHLKWYREFMRWRIEWLAYDLAEAMFLALRDVGTRCPGLREYLTGVQALGWPVPLRLGESGIAEAAVEDCRDVRVLANPGRNRVAIRYTVPAGTVRIDLLDVTGRRVATLAREAAVDAGTYTLRWDGSDASGRRLASGVYTVVVHSARGKSASKLTLLH